VNATDTGLPVQAISIVHVFGWNASGGNNTADVIVSDYCWFETKLHHVNKNSTETAAFNDIH
jgi:hypothetical protein